MMKLWKVVLLIFLVGAFMGRPVKSVHEDKMRNYVLEASNSQDRLIYKIGSAVGSELYVKYNDYYLFTTTSIDGRIVGVGAFRGVVLINNILIINFLKH